MHVLGSCLGWMATLMGCGLWAVVSKGRFRRELDANTACAGLAGLCASSTKLEAVRHEGLPVNSPNDCYLLGLRQQLGVPCAVVMLGRQPMVRVQRNRVPQLPGTPHFLSEMETGALRPVLDL